MVYCLSEKVKYGNFNAGHNFILAMIRLRQYTFRDKISCGILYAGRMENYKRITGFVRGEAKEADKKDGENK